MWLWNTKAWSTIKRWTKQHFTSLCPFSGQLNQRINEGRIQGKDQEKGHTSGQSARGSAKERSENRLGKPRRYQGYWMGISIVEVREGFKLRAGLTWLKMGAALQSYTEFIGLPLPTHPSLPNFPCHHWQWNCANRLISLEQWCQLFVPSSPWLFPLSDCCLTLSPRHHVSLSQSWRDIGWEYCWYLQAYAPGNTAAQCSRVCLAYSLRSISQ